MALSADAQWYPLVVTTILPPRSPPLLVQRSFTNATYSIYLTDLTHIWGETLSRRDIVQRALNEDTSIDPSEDASQLRILLEKLKEGLSLSDDECRDRYNIKVHLDAVPAKPPKSAISTGTVIQLKITYQLPEPLLPLVWMFKLQPLPQTQLTNMLLLPLLSLTSLHSAQVNTLIPIIKDKDMVIEKMKDALSEFRIPLVNVMAGVAARKRGLEKFHDGNWRSQIMESQARSSPRPERLVKSVFGSVDGDRHGSVRSSNCRKFNQEWQEAAIKFEENVNNSQANNFWWDYIEPASKNRSRKRMIKAFDSDQESDTELPTSGEVSKHGEYVSSRGSREYSSTKTYKHAKGVERPIDQGPSGIRGKKRRNLQDEDEDEFEVCTRILLYAHHNVCHELYLAIPLIICNLPSNRQLF